MDNLKSKTDIVLESIVAFYSILFLAIAIRLKALAVIGLFASPIIIFYINKKNIVKSITYYFILFGSMIVSFLFLIFYR